jgi:hypothetical protein
MNFILAHQFTIILYGIYLTNGHHEHKKSLYIKNAVGNYVFQNKVLLATVVRVKIYHCYVNESLKTTKFHLHFSSQLCTLLYILTVMHICPMKVQIFKVISLHCFI